MAKEITEAIILDSMDYRETSQFIYVYTKKFGKINLILKGVRKQNSPFTGRLEPFTQGKLYFYFRKRKTLYSLSNFIPEVLPSVIRSDYKRIVSAFYIVELIRKTTMEFQPHPEFFDLITCTINLLNQKNIHNFQNILRIFELKIIKIHGFQPQLDVCLICKRKNKNTGFFSAAKGGVICSACCHLVKGKIRISPGTLNFLRKSFQISLNKITSITISKNLSNELKAIIDSIHHYYFERDFQSLKILEAE